MRWTRWRAGCVTPGCGTAGARIGRSINYVPGLNVDADGTPKIDGILADDSATGLWQPIVMQEGKDALFATERERAGFVPQIDVTHQMYNAETPGDRPSWVSKRQSARGNRAWRGPVPSSSMRWTGLK